MFMYIMTPNDGQTYEQKAGEFKSKYRYSSIDEVKALIENRAKKYPTESFTAMVVDEDTMTIVAWTKYSPKPIVEWNYPAPPTISPTQAKELEQLFNLDNPTEDKHEQG